MLASRESTRFIGLLVLVVLATIALTAGCSGNAYNAPPTPTPTPAPALQSIAVSPQGASVAAGLTQQFSATGSFSDGTTRPLTSATWTTTDSNIATVDAAGLVTTAKQGSVTVSAASGSVTGSTALTVGPPLPVRMSISPASSAVLLGAGTTKLSALLTFTDHSTLDVSSQVTWSDTDPFVATIDATGNVTALHDGYAKIAATNANFTAAADLTVFEVPRYLYVGTNAGRIISRATIDPGTGQLRMAGNVITNANNLAFTCETTDPSHQFLYLSATVAGGSPPGEMLIYSIDQNTGALTAILGSPFATTAPIGCIQFERTGKFGYASSIIDGTNQLLAYSRDAGTGALTQISNITLNGTALKVAVDPQGQYLYAATIALSNPAQAYGYSIDSTTGALTPVPGTPFMLSNVTGVFSFHPLGDFLYMANTNGQSIDTYSVDRSTGALTAAGSLQTCINPTALHFSANGQFGYTACSMDANHDANSASVESFAVSANGALTHLGSTPSANAPFDLLPDPSGHFLYLSANASYVYSFAIGSDGVAKFARRVGVMPNQSQSVVAVGGSSALKYTTKFAYISSTGDNKLTTYPVKADGTFGAAAGLPTTTQLTPFSLSLLPWESNLLVASSAPHPNLVGYPLSATTGLPGAGSNFGDAATSGGVAIDPTEQWAFETDSANGVVFTYLRMGTSWFLLTYVINGINVSSFSAGAGAGPMLIDPFGRFLYVANQDPTANSISAFQYFGTSPELLASTGSPFSIGAKPLALAMDPAGAFLYVVANDQTLQVYAVDYFGGGSLTKMTSVSLAGQPAGVAAETTGRYVYAANTGEIKVFSVNAQSGVLTLVPLSPAISLSNIAGLFVDPSGKYLYATTSATGTGAVFAYTINSDGTLTAVSGSPIATPNQPSSLTFSADIR